MCGLMDKSQPVLMPDAGRRRALRMAGLLSAACALVSPLWARAGEQRLVSIGGALTEILYVLGAEAALVGVDTTSLYPAAVKVLPSVGYARTLSAEGVLALRPSQVLATEDAGPPQVLRQLQAAGVPVAILAANHRFEGLLERVRQVGALTGRSAPAEKLVQALRDEWTSVQATVAQASNALPRVLFVLAHAPNQIMVAGRDTSAQALISYVGAKNVIDRFDGYKPLTPEAVIGARPDVVLLTEQGLQASGGIDSVLRLPGMAQTPAGRKRRVVALEATYLLGFGPRLPAAVAELHRLLYGAMRA